MGLEKLKIKEAELLIKPRAQEKDFEFFYKIQNLDLIAKNFWFHNTFLTDIRPPTPHCLNYLRPSFQGNFEGRCY